MSTNDVFSPKRPAELWTLPATVDSGVPVISISNQPGVTETPTGDFTKSQVVGPYTVSGIPGGGVGYQGKEAGVYVDGTFVLPVTGALTTTPQNTSVYAVVAGGVVTSLTLTAGSNVLFGKVNYPKDYVKVAGKLPVQIGANL
jgi:hypothetical protein